jgi:hypothetical protein
LPGPADQRPLFFGRRVRYCLFQIEYFRFAEGIVALITVRRE